MELNNKLMYYRRTKNLKDTSQHENYMCFRNELYNNKPMVMTPSFYDTLPNYGSLDFDFVQFSRPMPAVPLSFRRAPTPAVRTLNPKVYDELIDLQRFRTRIPELYALMLFDRILDLYNYSQVFTALVDSEVAQLIFRLGWLNLWSPLIPEMYYGENWQGATFGWDRDSPMPGWVLNMSWLTPGNFPQKGYLRVEYYSGADKGCSPVWASRHTSAQNVLAELPKQFDVFLAHREALRRLGRRGSSGENAPKIIDPLDPNAPIDELLPETEDSLNPPTTSFM
ncbi:hypothetical protein DYB37_008460 [Aphanomyces astaci]|uniref:Uncharacterized protein n=1 Tax=Aphanomyces astaci TaxID=112090 RepID=A0A3R6XLW2_APHAT|nr:hypothetical protein DYB35_008257 [Aphanomyces astaci]RHZ16362.1 hypothetical protein DYB37_008460 [Aphanomyces astaci]